MKSVNTVEKIILVFVFALIIVGLVLSYVNVEIFENYYVNEDGATEWLTVVGFIFGMCVCFRRAVVLRSKRPIQFIALTLLLGFAFLFCAGEEISWGQRLFQFESPHWFRAHNAQKETNLHNLKVGQIKINKWIFSWGVAVAVTLYFGVMAPLYGCKKVFARAVDRWAVPIPRLYQLLACLAMIVIVQLLVNSSKKPELSEFGSAFLFLLIVMFPRNKAIYDPGTDVRPDCVKSTDGV